MIMAIFLWILSVLLSSIVSLIIGFSFNSVINNWLTPIFSKFAFLNVKTKITGIWIAEFQYDSKKYVEVIEIKKILGTYIGNIIPDHRNYDELKKIHNHKPYRLSGQTYKEDFITGIWKNPKSRNGYHGAFQLFIDDSNQKMYGKWIGYRRDKNKELEFAVEKWEWKRANYIEHNRIAIYGVSGSGKTTLAKALVSKLQNTVYMSESETLKSYFGSFDKFLNLKETERQKYREIALSEKFLEIAKLEKDMIADCHYSFPKKNLGKMENELKKDSFKEVMPEICKETYNAIIYLDTPANLIVDRIPVDKKTYYDDNIFEIKKWQHFEKERLKRICRRKKIDFLIISESDIDKKIKIIFENLGINEKQQCV